MPYSYKVQGISYLSFLSDTYSGHSIEGVLLIHSKISTWHTIRKRYCKRIARQYELSLDWKKRGDYRQPKSGSNCSAIKVLGD